MRLSAIVPELTVNSVERSIEFYRSMFAFAVVATAPELGELSWAEISNGDARLMMQARADMVSEIPVLAGRPIGGTAVLVLQTSREVVRQFAAAHPDAVTAGMPLRETEYGTSEAAVIDPDGYLVLLAGR